MPERLCHGLYPAAYVAVASGRRDSGGIDEPVLQPVFHVLRMYAAMSQGTAFDGYHERPEAGQRQTDADARSFERLVLPKISGKRAPARPGSGNGIHDALFFSHEKSPASVSVRIAGNQGIFHG